MTRIRHGRISLELTQLAARPGDTLLLLHALYGSSAEWSDGVLAWPGAVYALDFSGHGKSDCIEGGAYTPELLAADADTALAQLGTATLAGAGLGAYVALLLAGARADRVPAALLLPGTGLVGGVPPDHREPIYDLGILSRSERHAGEGDPLLGTLAGDPRPPDYAAAFASATRRLLFAPLNDPPHWWVAARRSPVAEDAHADLARSLAQLAAG